MHRVKQNSLTKSGLLPARCFVFFQVPAAGYVPRVSAAENHTIQIIKNPVAEVSICVINCWSADMSEKCEPSVQVN